MSFETHGSAQKKQKNKTKQNKMDKLSFLLKSFPFHASKRDNLLLSLLHKFYLIDNLPLVLINGT